MVTVRYGGKDGYSINLDVSDSLLAVRTQTRMRSVATNDPVQGAPLSDRARVVMRNFDLRWKLPRVGVEVFKTAGPDAVQVRDTAREVLKAESTVRFAGRVLNDPGSGAPVLYTENFFVKFDDDEDERRCEDVLANYKLNIKRKLTYARNAYFAEAAEGTGLSVFEIAGALLHEPEVQLCHPELIRERRPRGAFPQQWHLATTTINGQPVDASANVVNAWSVTKGEGTTIAIIDTGIDIDHEEFRSGGKVVAPFDATSKDNDPRPVDFNDEMHGTACAGVACGDGNFGASGVAPRARLMPIRLQSELGSQDEADAFEWAARHGADVISCSWGPEDGDFRDPADPRHNQFVPLADSTRVAIDFAVTQGRNGKGCVVLFAAGNGNESVDNDGYASNPKVIAVAACNDSGTKSPYSDKGNAVWCAFPSNNFFPSKTPGIWTTDITGKRGYNAGNPFPHGDAAGNYTNSFGGTSSACPGAAGVAALIISSNPDLRWDEVKDVFKRSGDRIDAANGQYDANGHSPIYGFGRVNARKAVDAAIPVAPSQHRVVRRIQPNAAISDFQTTTAILDVPDAQPILSIKASVDIEHTYIGDLRVTLQPPAGVAAAPILLHAREGGSTDNLKKTYDGVSTPALQGLAGKAINGKWTLSVEDQAAQDQGTLREFSLEINF